MFLVLTFISSVLVATPKQTQAATPLEELLEGNQRYVNNTPKAHNEVRDRTALVSKQNPVAIVIGCADSRVPPEIVFDQYLGDLFVVRVAGNVVGPLELDSIDYAVKELNVPLIMVLGHQSCGAVSAVLSGEGKADGIEHITPYIQPSVDQTKKLPGNHLENAIKANVQHVISDLKRKTLLKKRINEKKLEIRGGYYHLDSGTVEMLPVKK